MKKELFAEKTEYWMCKFFFQSWRYLNLGIHIDLSYPNIEFHVPFGFIKIGRSVRWYFPTQVIKDYGWEGAVKLLSKREIKVK